MSQRAGRDAGSARPHRDHHDHPCSSGSSTPRRGREPCGEDGGSTSSSSSSSSVRRLASRDRRERARSPTLRKRRRRRSPTASRGSRSSSRGSQSRRRHRRDHRSRPRERRRRRGRAESERSGHRRTREDRCGSSEAQRAAGEDETDHADRRGAVLGDPLPPPLSTVTVDGGIASPSPTMANTNRRHAQDGVLCSTAPTSHTETADERRQLTRTATRMRGVVGGHAGQHGAAPCSDLVLGAPSLHPLPSTSPLLHPPTPALLPTARAPPPPPPSLGDAPAADFSEDEYLAWLATPASSAKARADAASLPGTTAAPHTLPRGERVAGSLSDPRQTDRRDLAGASDVAVAPLPLSAPGAQSGADAVLVHEPGTPPPACAPAVPAELSYERGFSIFSSWEALVAAPPLSTTTPRMPRYLASSPHVTAAAAAAATQPTPSTPAAHGLALVDASLPATAAPLRGDAVRRLEEGSARTFLQHFTHGLVFVDPPWFICPALLDNCEHPYYMTWLDELEVGSVAEAVAEAKMRLQADA
ncbi:hypothetical protein NESM_000335700 [Novymonas esmeraldas]|uniref:Uncharacterized protein n=1 Tax=Novymonas esmeraldas TaxID=1808958 RepID=A0AAW0EM40_9TRYP